MVPPVSHRVSRVLRYSGSWLIQLIFRLRDYHPLWSAFPCRSARLSYRSVSPQPRRINPPVCPLPRSLATTSGISVDFSSSPYLDVSVQAVPHLRLFDSTQVDGVLLRRVSPFGNPWIISPMCGSPRLIAACHVLLRLLMPRHSPCALFSLTCHLFSEILVLTRIMQASVWLHCSLCYPFKSPQIKTLLPLCCLLAISCLLHCSVFKVQLPTLLKVRLKCSGACPNTSIRSQWWRLSDSNR